jgi:hypothetical protein
MRFATVLAAVTVLGLGVGAARADDRVGTVQAVHGRTFTLDDGNVYHLETNTAPEARAELKVGNKVRVTYEANADANYVSDIQPVR